MPDEDDTLLNAAAQRDLRNRNLKVLAAYSDSDEFKRLVEEVISGKKSALEASMSPIFGQVMGPIAEKAAELNPEWFQSPAPEDRNGR
ncbi:MULTISPECIES: hypothetical protein [Mycobacteroides]|jgi:tRNA(His) 5'-end guanylyltransferase|nr:MULTISPECIES: hypothetical protein [Mycobacteroides]KRQ32825.1 hypothetical protein AOT91_10305 [Mycobacteroides sp. H092]KRQ44646.1 hypothetical protein AOT92_04705 [Mycobacteroides sp. H101]KRQ64920.1 hypothetical protein AOT90_08060 [Mycobacteroides sp. H079]KRQ82275.1 hypothetical protein AOT95_08615 [Mycobacteroides sp. HXXIII]KRQ83610.1 hypothetical protein AOT93_07325 [Mycobacteroides sp. H110]